jgi:hypothetical protein
MKTKDFNVTLNAKNNAQTAVIHGCLDAALDHLDKYQRDWPDEEGCPDIEAVRAMIQKALETTYTAVIQNRN